jgi:hypothetical protein
MVLMRATFLFLIGSLFWQVTTRAQPALTPLEKDRARAMQLLRGADTVRQSMYWPHIKPADYFNNVRINIQEPLRMGTGSGTNFCAYGAVSYTSLMNEPARYAACMIDLYVKGEAFYRNIRLAPPLAIREAAGTLEYQGSLDTRPADQAWFLCLAHRFKGYLNFFNQRYQKGDENTVWAGTNLAKFNRMLRRLCKYKIGSHGFDIIRPGRRNLVAFFEEKLKQGEVYLYLNNSILRRKTHNRIRQKLPTHYVVLLGLTKNGEDLTSITYWDGEYKTLKELTNRQLRQVLFGYSWVKYKERNDD